MFLSLVLMCGAESALAESCWQPQSGLPTKAIAALLQTRDGYLWIGTYEGAFRYDGVDFTPFDSRRVPQWHDSSATAFYETPDGALWIGHRRGAVSKYKDGVFTVFPARVGWKADRVLAIASDASGAIWALDNGGELARVGDSLVLKSPSGGKVGVLSMARSRDGRVWIVNGGRMSEIVGTELRSVEPPPGCTDAVQGVGAGVHGGIWVVAEGRLWQSVGDGGWRGESQELVVGNAPISTLLETKDGRLYLGTHDDGVLELLPGEPRPTRLYGRGTGLPSSWVLASCEDHEGNVWLGSGSSGLFRLQELKVSMVVAPDQWQGRAVLTVCSTSDHGFLVGTEGAGIYRLTGNGRWSTSTRETGLRNNYVWAVCEDRDGTLLAGTWDGLDSTKGEGFGPAPGTHALTGPTLALLPARDGGLWVGGRDGLARYEAGVFRWIEPEGTRKLNNIRGLLEAPDGTLWVSTNGEGIGRVRNGEVRQYLQRDGLNSDYTHGLLLDETGTLWIGTHGGGLNRFKDGRFSAVSVENGLESSAISQIEDDGLGYLWMSSRAGILRVSKSELNACADGRLRKVQCLTYGQGDGLTTLACSNAQPAPGCRAADGRLVFATDTGLALIDPRSVRTNVEAPPVSIESVRVGEQLPVQAPFLEAVEIGPGARRIEIKYTGLSFAVPERVRFKCQLDGLDSDWVDMGAARRVVYSYLPPGRYVFRVTAANNDGVWSPVGRSLKLMVRPFFWETLWFRLLLGLLFMGAVGGIVWFQARRRLLRRVELLEREQAIAAERTRIANDMHDDIGAGLTRINMLASNARSNLDDRARVEKGLTQIRDASRSVKRAVDEIIWAVNPRHDTFESLLSYLEKTAQELLGAAQMRCRLNLPLETNDWRPNSEVRHNLFLAYKEALNNAVRHSGGRCVTISLVMDGDECRLTVADDGRGGEGGPVRSAENARAASGNGLPGMRRRLARIGGSCEIRNGAAGGTEVIFRIPARPPEPTRKLTR